MRFGRLLVLLMLCALLRAQEGDAGRFDATALLQIVRISDPQLSPDGSAVVYVAGRPSLAENKVQSHIYVVGVDGGASLPLTSGDSSNHTPRWDADGEAIYFLSDRSGSTQLWRMPATGGSSEAVSDLPLDVEEYAVGPRGDAIFLTSRVVDGCGADLACTKERLAQRKTSGVEARTYDGLLYRHWDRWDDGTLVHLMRLDLASGDATDLTPDAGDVPHFSLGGSGGFDVSPDGNELVVAVGPAGDPATSTNNDLYVVDGEDGGLTAITTNLAADTDAKYSPDGRWIAYRSQEEAGYESDRFRLRLYERETGIVRTLTEAFDRSVSSFAWAPDSERIFFTAPERGREPVYTVGLSGGGARMAVYGNARHSSLQIAPDGESLIYLASSGSAPAQILRAFARGGTPIVLTRTNDALLDPYSLSPLDEIEWESVDGEEISGFLVRPPGFVLTKKYPLLVLIHGGPQGAWGQSWSYRWNAQVFANAGFLVFMPNPRGSVGYGQRFTDEIRGDWGGMAYHDIMSGVDHMTDFPYVDAERMVAAGASYGGYMVNWILGHSTRFRALVSHAGVYDLESFFGATEELWFPLWEFGSPPWKDRAMYRQWSPSEFVEAFETPTLVVHGAKDYRVPDTQGMQLYTALQMEGVPSHFVYFPDEGHWVRKPRNSIYWYASVIDWLQRWSAPAAGDGGEEPASQIADGAQ